MIIYRANKVLQKCLHNNRLLGNRGIALSDTISNWRGYSRNNFRREFIEPTIYRADKSLPPHTQIWLLSPKIGPYNWGRLLSICGTKISSPMKHFTHTGTWQLGGDGQTQANTDKHRWRELRRHRLLVIVWCIYDCFAGLMCIWQFRWFDVYMTVSMVWCMYNSFHWKFHCPRYASKPQKSNFPVSRGAHMNL